MNRKDLPIFVLLAALLIAWPYIDRHVIRPLFPERATPEAVEDAVEYEPDRAPAPPHAPDLDPDEDDRAALAEAPAPPVPEETADELPEERVTLRNDDVEFTFSSRGASVVAVRILDYRRSIDPDSGPVMLNFEDQPALSYEALPGLGAESSFTVKRGAGSVSFHRSTASGLALRRTITLGETGYLLRIEDAFSNEADAAIAIPTHRLASGIMRPLPGESTMRGVVYMGVDTLSPGGERVAHWGRRMARIFRDEERARGAEKGRLDRLETTLVDRASRLDWASAKNKYFAQIIRPEFGAEAAHLLAARDVTERGQPITEVGIALEFEGVPMEPRQADAVRVLNYYAGPKKLDALTDLGHHQVSVMEFGRMAPVSRLLLRVLNLFYSVVSNYGVAIILLTVLIRIIFWPITHKSTQSMRRMQSVQPLLKELREKHKDNPQKLQRETMALYKEHKVNPLGSCLPMVIQIPVFIALFVVLRSAIELRFAPFLWVRDLSEPENLFAGQLPFGLSLNILPLFMTGVTFWQQKLTPTAGGDPSQQKMMMMMPFIMLIFFYNFAAGLVLYWTTNQLLMVAQQLLHRYRTNE